MDRRKNLPVLPSNAPALSPRTSILSSQSEDVVNTLSSFICQKYNRGHECRVCNLYHVCSTCQQPGHGAHLCQAGVLRASSGNAGLTPLEPSVFDSKYRSDSRYGVSKTSSTYINPPHHTAQAAIRLSQKKERRNIWQRWELQSPRYLAYRRKARSKKPGSKEDVWPDDVEEAFQIAIRLYAKRGRTKDELNGRQAGGNEFISDWIEKQTGHVRCRKQISSHIQTLKGFLSDIPSWMDLVTAWPPGKNEKAKVIKSTGIGYDESPDFASNTDNVDCVQQIPCHRGYPNTKPHRVAAAAILGSNAAQDPTIRGVQFDMHLSSEAANTKTHIYTSIQSEIGSAARTLEQVPNWQAMFPHLATRYNEGRIDCPLFLFEAQLRLIDDIRLGLSLGIEFAIDFAEGAYFYEWRSLTRVHKQDITPQYFDDSEFEQTWDRLECLESGNGQSDIQLTVPFKSKWWVKLFSSIISKRDGARNAKDREAIKWADEYPSAYLRELSVMQELWARPKGGSSQRPQRMAILLWTFSQTRNGEAATTTWRPLTLSTSASPYHVQEPIPRGMQPAMNLDSALQESMTAQRSHRNVQTQYANEYNSSGHHQPPGLFSETTEQLLASHISECNTESTTPILDFHSSFPSSTSTSFPSSISNASGFPAHHGSSFDSSTDGQSYASLESSFHAQQDPTMVYSMGTDTDTTPVKPQIHHGGYTDSQDLLYPSQPTSVYGSLTEFPPFEGHHQHEGDTTIVLDAQTDYPNGEAVQLVYASSSAQSMNHLTAHATAGVYEQPLIAPRANIIPQSQLEQSLRDFETWVPPPPSAMTQDQHLSASMPMSQLSPHNQRQQDRQGDESDEDDMCGGRSGSSMLSPASNERECRDQEISAEAEQERHHHHQQRQQQQQLRYLHDAQDHWQHNFHPVMWAAGLQIPGAMDDVAGGAAVMNLRGEAGQPVGEGQVLGEVTETRGLFH